MRKCPISDCGKSIPSAILMCKPHWHKVPKTLRDRVWVTYRDNGGWSDEYLDARDAAIHAVEAAS